MIIAKTVFRVRHYSEPRTESMDQLPLLTDEQGNVVSFTKSGEAAAYKQKFQAENPGWTAYMQNIQHEVAGGPPAVRLTNDELLAKLFGSPEAAPTPEPESVPENF